MTSLEASGIKRRHQLRAWFMICHGWALVVAHRLSGGVGYPRVRTLAGKGSRGSKSDPGPLADKYLMVEAILKSRAPIDRKLLMHTFVGRLMSHRGHNVPSIVERFPELLGMQGPEAALKGYRKRLAIYAINRLRL